MKESKDEQKNIENEYAKDEPPNNGVWSDKGAIWHVNDTDENKDNNDRNDASSDVVESVIWGLLHQRHIEQPDGDQYQCRHSVGTPTCKYKYELVVTS